MCTHYCLAVLLATLAGGCMSVAERDRSLAPTKGSELVYFRDARTGLCFAGHDLAFNSAVLTNVPCTPEVQQVIASQSAESGE